MDEHPNNKRNRDMARGCHATYHFLDGRFYRTSFLPKPSSNYGLQLRGNKDPEEVFWWDGKYEVVTGEPNYFFGPDFVQPFHQLKFINLEEFIPVWDGNIPRLPE